MASQVELVLDEEHKRVEVNALAMLFEDLIESSPVVDVKDDVLHSIDEKGDGLFSPPRFICI